MSNVSIHKQVMEHVTNALQRSDQARTLTRYKLNMEKYGIQDTEFTECETKRETDSGTVDVCTGSPSNPETVAEPVTKETKLNT